MDATEEWELGMGRGGAGSAIFHCKPWNRVRYGGPPVHYLVVSSASTTGC